MGAVTAALDTHELLETIITYLPSRDVPRAQRVCKTWQQLIQGSIRIKEVRPLRPHPKNTFLQRNGEHFTCQLRYSSEAGVSLHPALGGSVDSYATRLDPEIWEVLLDIGPGALRALEDTDAFVAEPPITRLMMYKNAVGGAQCEIYSRHGITLEDVKSVGSALLRASGKKKTTGISICFLICGPKPRVRRRTGAGSPKTAQAKSSRRLG